MSYQLIETAIVSGAVLAAGLYAAARWWPARLQPLKRWRREAAGCGSGCGGCSSSAGSSSAGTCGSTSRIEGGGQTMLMPNSRHTSR